MVYGYKSSDEGITFLGSSEDIATLEKALTMANIDITDMQVTEEEPIFADGKYYLNAEDAKDAIARQKKREAFEKLDSEYTRQKQELSEQFSDDMLHGDTEAMDADREAMTKLDAWYDEEYAKIEGSEE